VSGLSDLLGSDAAKAVGGLVEQFEQGQAHQVSPQDAAAHHDAVAQHLTPQQYEQAAKDAVEKLTPDQREELGKQLTAAAKAQGHDVDAMLAPHGGNPSSPGGLGALMSALQGTPGGISGLLSTKGAESLVENQAVRSALVGVAATAAKKFL
jgi:hypothetical protein